MKNNFKLFISFLILFFSCKESTNEFIITGGNATLTVVEFNQTSIDIREGYANNTITINFSKSSLKTGTIEISINNISATYGTDYTTSPAPTNNLIRLNVRPNDTNASFTLTPEKDNDTDEEVIEFSISNAEGGVTLGNRLTMTLTILDNCFKFNSNYSGCLSSLASDELNVITWNLKFFPTNGNTTISLVTELIENIDADIIALQEINNINDFNTLVANLCNWEGKVVNLSGSLDIGYLYKISEITSFTIPTAILSGSVFPRPPVKITITHNNGLEVTLLNIHLKCCGGSNNISRRRTASIAIKNYIDDNLSNDNVILLGDFNDHINSNSPFDNFIEDSNNYQFADANIATGSSSNWSYPSWPSHIDHLLITNELADNLMDVRTLKLNICTSNYEANVSDHLPVMATFRK